jgi:hypothetical protein
MVSLRSCRLDAGMSRRSALGLRLVTFAVLALVLGIWVVPVITAERFTDGDRAIVPERFPVIVGVHPGRSSGEPRWTVVRWDELEKFRLTNPHHTFLLPGADGAFRQSGDDTGSATYRTTSVSPVRQRVAVTFATDRHTFVGRYEAEDKQIFPRYFNFSGFAAALYAIPVSFILTWGFFRVGRCTWARVRGR